MRASIPTTYYVINYMMEEYACWIGEPLLVVNFNVSWNQYASLQTLERIPEALDLAERLGADPHGVDKWRANLFSGFCHFWTELFTNDPLENHKFFEPARVVMRMKHLDSFVDLCPKLYRVYEQAYLSGHPAAKLHPGELFSAFNFPKSH